MRLRLDRYQEVYKSLRRRAFWLSLLGGVPVVIGTFGGFVAFVLFFDPAANTTFEHRTSFFLGIFVGVLPITLGLVMIWRGLVGRQRVRRLRDLGARVLERPDLPVDGLARALELAPIDAERLLLDAVALGLIDLEGSPSGNGRDLAVVGAGSSSPPPRLLAAPTMPVVIGTVLKDTYRVDAFLGAGGMGAVYAATHLRTGRTYALKTLLPDARIDEETSQRFEREARAAGSLGHANIVAVHDFDHTPEGLSYLVMDLLQGETLEQRLTRIGSLPFDHARRVALELSAALAAAHAAGVLHRDVKPANVFLAALPGAPERAVLLDFGLAKPLEPTNTPRVTASGAAVGTPLYMSPEQARGDEVDARTDVYGLGAVLYEMVTGAPPFFDRTLAGAYARLLTEPAPSVHGLSPHPMPPALDGLIAWLLAKRPAERCPSVTDAKIALERVPSPAT